MRNSVYSDVDIEKGRLKTQRLLKEFPELYAVRSRWGCHGWRNVKIRRAPAMRFLQGGVCLSPGMTSIRIYVVTSLPEVRDLLITNAGNKISAVSDHQGAYQVGDPDGIALQKLLNFELLWWNEENDLAKVRYVLLAEEGPLDKWLITVVKPPIGEKSFGKYVGKLLERSRLRRR